MPSDVIPRRAASFLKRRAADAIHRATVPLRRRYYCEGSGQAIVPKLPRRLRAALGLDDREAVGSRKIEVGCGPFPRPGYIHVDLDPSARHLEAITDARSLPFPSDWAEEIVAVHSLEHVKPPALVPTLREWHRVLAPGGRVQIHVPNTAELAQAFLESPVEEKWRVMGALLGMYSNPRTKSPGQLVNPSDHQLLFDMDTLAWSLEGAGFSQVSDLTTSVVDRHTDAWREVVPHFSLVAEAVKSPTPS